MGMCQTKRLGRRDPTLDMNLSEDDIQLNWKYGNYAVVERDVHVHARIGDPRRKQGIRAIQMRQTTKREATSSIDDPIDYKIITGGNDGSLGILKCSDVSETGQPEFTLEQLGRWDLGSEQGTEVRCLQFNEQYLFVGLSTGDLLQYDIDTITQKDAPAAKRLQVMGQKAHRGTVWCLDFEGATLVSGGADTVVREWNIDTHRAVAPEMTGHTKAVLCVKLILSQNRIISGGEDGDLRIWERSTHTCIHKLSVARMVTCLDVPLHHIQEYMEEKERQKKIEELRQAEQQAELQELLRKERHHDEDVTADDFILVSEVARKENLTTDLVEHHLQQQQQLLQQQLQKEAAERLEREAQAVEQLIEEEHNKERENAEAVDEEEAEAEIEAEQQSAAAAVGAVEEGQAVKQPAASADHVALPSDAASRSTHKTKKLTEEQASKLLTGESNESPQDEMQALKDSMKNIVIVGASNGVVTLYDIHSGRVLMRLTGGHVSEKKRIYSVEMSGDGSRIVSCAEDNRIIIWEKAHSAESEYFYQKSVVLRTARDGIFTLGQSEGYENVTKRDESLIGPKAVQDVRIAYKIQLFPDKILCGCTDGKLIFYHFRVPKKTPEKIEDESETESDTDSEF